jgi:hypothetical protein
MSDLIFHTVAVVEQDGILVLENLSLKEGQQVEVAVFGTETSEQDTEDPLSLRGEPFFDQDPFEPVAVEDWEALQ